MSAATLTIPEAAELLGISRNSAYQAVQSGELVGVPVLKVGRRLLLPRAPLFAVLGLQDEEPTEAGSSTISSDRLRAVPPIEAHAGNGTTT